jgi:ABC-type amino acid transport substrate-binding protein
VRTWGEVFQNDTTTGILADLAGGQAEAGIASMIMTSRRMDKMDFTIPLLSPK